MQYYVSDEKKGKRWGLASALLYLALWVVLMILIKFPPVEAKPYDEGILINFGNTEAAGGLEDTRLSDDQAQRPVEARPSTAPSQLVTSPHGDVEVPQPDKPRPTTQPDPVEQPRQADPRSLFPGRTPGSTSPAEGTSTGAGNQGNLAGSPEGSHDGTGTGTSGTAYNLTGRSSIGALPLPAYNRDREGKVVIEITVNPEGQVINARHNAKGSTLTDGQLIEAARQAALKSRFNKAEIENNQVGTITYVFKMK